MLMRSLVECKVQSVGKHAAALVLASKLTLYERVFADKYKL